MVINCSKEESTLTVSLEGRLDTTTAPVLEGQLKDACTDISRLVFDFEKLDYISSAGLRILLSFQKQMSRKGTMVVRHINETIAEIFEVTGFSDVLTIE